MSDKFIYVNKKWKNNITEFVSYSDRIALLKFKIDHTKTLTIIQVYAPTSTHTDDEIEEFYDLLNRACDEHRGTWMMVIGDFNAKIGSRLPSDNQSILGPHGLGSRNERGKRLIQFASNQNFNINNTFFYKKPQRRWTWFSPDGSTKNEIDFSLSSTRQIITNVEVLNNFKFSSDHRPLRITIQLNQKIQRARMIKNSIKKLDKLTLIANKERFVLELKNSFQTLNLDSEDVEIQYNNISKCIKTASQNIKTVKYKTKKLSPSTLKMIDDRQKLNIHTPEYKAIDREVKRKIRTDIRNYNTQLIKTTLEKNQSLRIAIRGTEKGKVAISNLKDKFGIKQTDKEKILNICTEYYTCLYAADNITQTHTNTYSYSESIPLITGHEVHQALLSMKYSKTPGEDGITTEALKIGEPILLPHITNLFNTILKTGTLPENFCHSNIIILHKKGDKSDLANYRPISLVSHLYKAFIKVLENRISGKLDQQQPAEQAGFRRGLSTTDHLHTLNQIIEKYSEFNLPLYIAFIDYSKAFDSLTHSSIFTALHNQDIHPTYINLLQNIYFKSTAAIKLHKLGQSFPISKGVKQGDPLSPKLFTATLEEVFKKLSACWSTKGVVVGEKRLTNLRFADDIVLFSSSASELGGMINELSGASLEVGLKMNMSKTKLMTNSIKYRLEVDGAEIEYVHEYIYLGQIVSFQARQEREVI